MLGLGPPWDSSLGGRAWTNSGVSTPSPPGLVPRASLWVRLLFPLPSAKLGLQQDRQHETHPSSQGQCDQPASPAGAVLLALGVC